MITGNYVLTYLYNQPKLTQFVIQGLVSLFARITKLGWFDAEEEEFVFRDVITDISKFLQVGFPPELNGPNLCQKLPEGHSAMNKALACHTGGWGSNLDMTKDF